MKNLCCRPKCKGRLKENQAPAVTGLNHLNKHSWYRAISKAHVKRSRERKCQFFSNRDSSFLRHWPVLNWKSVHISVHKVKFHEV